MASVPDAKKMVIDWLLADSGVRAIASTRVYSVIPAVKKGASDNRFPLVRVVRVGGAPMTRPLYIDRPHLQIDCFGGPEKTTWELAEAVMVRMDAMPGSHHSTEGVVSAVVLLNVGDMPDTEFSPAKPRVRMDMRLATHAAQLLPT